MIFALCPCQTGQATLIRQGTGWISTDSTDYAMDHVRLWHGFDAQPHRVMPQKCVSLTDILSSFLEKTWILCKLRMTLDLSTGLTPRPLLPGAKHTNKRKCLTTLAVIVQIENYEVRRRERPTFKHNSCLGDWNTGPLCSFLRSNAISKAYYRMTSVCNDQVTWNTVYQRASLTGITAARKIWCCEYGNMNLQSSFCNLCLRNQTYSCVWLRWT